MYAPQRLPICCYLPAGSLLPPSLTYAFAAGSLQLTDEKKTAAEEEYYKDRCECAAVHVCSSIPRSLLCHLISRLPFCLTGYREHVGHVDAAGAS